VLLSALIKGESMRLFCLLAILVLLIGCQNPVDNAINNPPETFTFKFINIGYFPITALFLKPVSDTSNWGVSVLPVARLDSLQYVLLTGLAKGPVYAFKVQFDSTGIPIYLTHPDMPTGPDTITGHAAHGIGWSFGIGHSWGLETWVGEINVTP
jgi:hypothetical protein